MKIGDFLNTFAVNSGTPKDDAGLLSLLQNKELASIDIPDSIASKINSNYFTLDSAKNNPTLKSHFFAQALNGVDSELNKIMTDLQLEDTVKQELLSEQSTHKRTSQLIKKVAELEKSKASKAPGEKAELDRQIADLNGQIATLKSSTIAKSEYDALLNKHESELTNIKLNSILSDYNYSLPKEMAQELKLSTAKIALENSLKEKGVKIVRENGELKLKTSTDTDYYVDNKPVTIKDFADSVLAQNKLLVVSGNNNTPATPIVVTPSTSKRNTSSFEAAINTSVESMSRVAES